MATKLNEFPTNTRGVKYDFKTWLNGDIWKLVEGTDFNVKVQSFRGALYQAKDKMGLEIQTRTMVEDGKTVVIVQALGAAKDKPAPKAPAKKAPAKKAVAKPATA